MKQHACILLSSLVPLMACTADTGNAYNAIGQALANPYNCAVGVGNGDSESDGTAKQPEHKQGSNSDAQEEPGGVSGRRTYSFSYAALEALGKEVFFDNISNPSVQSCSSCHDPSTGWTSGQSDVHATTVVVPGAVPERFGTRRPPTIGYASYTPNFGDADGVDEGACVNGTGLGLECQGGLFLDGRAEGVRIGKEVFVGDLGLEEAYGPLLGPLADQALDPFSNDVEQNVPDGDDEGIPGADFVCRHVQSAAYAELYEAAWGEPLDCDYRVDIIFKRIAIAIAAWESSAEVNSFSSKRDLALECDWDDTPHTFPLKDLTDEENLGHDLFFGIQSDLNPEGKSAQCAQCHNSEGADSIGNKPEQLFTDNRFHHLGIPPNYERAGFWDSEPDRGLSHHTGPDYASHVGHFRTPTLRNVGKKPGDDFVKSFMHNGYFKSLEDVVHFYNTATLKLDPEACPPGTSAAVARARDCWPAPEFDNGFQSSSIGLMGDLGLTATEEAAIVAYLRTLSDQDPVVVPERPATPPAQNTDTEVESANPPLGTATLAVKRPAKPFLASFLPTPRTR